MSARQPMNTAPLDGTEVLLFTPTGAVTAWFKPGEWINHAEEREYDGAVWVCYDDAFLIEVEETPEGNFCEATGWMPIPP